MLLIRRFEERVAQLFMDGKIPGMLHLYIGEEAVGVGVISCLRKTDWITSTHRGHGHFLAKGADPSLMMAELMGKSTGYCGGKGGSMHIADIELGHLGANGIVGGGLTIAAGAALASKIKGRDDVAVCFFGDGALNIGEFHEALNMAGLWKLPVVYVCENNLYGLSTHVNRACAVNDISKRAAGYAMRGVNVDGMDVLAVRSEAEKAVRRARKGNGPTLIVCNTYRLLGHSRSDACPYRTKEEEVEWKARCPIAAFQQRLLTSGEMASHDLEELDAQVHAVVNASVEFALSSPEPDRSMLLEGIYA
jgi:pyruvate dehydrogenase E1 component alpha subunit